MFSFLVVGFVTSLMFLAMLVEGVCRAALLQAVNIYWFGWLPSIPKGRQLWRGTLLAHILRFADSVA
jgi:hypothetical protein